ncbi:amino acid ABC transporter permease [Comamonas serinivorans]|nr:amino acid ABC transporter permease [Comamonas serinivorans]
MRAPRTWAQDLWGSPWRAAFSLVVLALAAWALAHLLPWAVLQATWAPDAATCRAHREGACWGVVAEKWRPLLFGRYPFEAQWRPAVAGLLLMAMTLGSAWPRVWRWWLAPLWLAVLLTAGLLMGGGLGLPHVPTGQWGGLPLTIVLAVLGVALAFPLGLALALGRRSDWPVVRTLCASYIELVRGVPLISVLFMATFLLPLLWPVGAQPDVLLRVIVGLSLFIAAYLAEVIRGGLQAVPGGQVDAARALGFTRWGVQRHIVLPQALRMVVPALTNNVLGALKDTSLVTVVGLFELTGALSLALGGDPVWRPFYLEAYLFIALIYWVLCFGLARYSLWLEGYLRREHAI